MQLSTFCQRSKKEKDFSRQQQLLQLQARSRWRCFPSHLGFIDPEVPSASLPLPTLVAVRGSSTRQDHAQLQLRIVLQSRVDVQLKTRIVPFQQLREKYIHAACCLVQLPTRFSTV